ncbi:coiled-coil domain-containing protein 169-like isoform X1 [Centruroides sculpturatus]|uniref:coiled-coil domain-containing protein 169-like isoform X1 n=1 Tax=Centruroides sculpturatus TaxID=218467 RepID=UPI000C6E22B9|nr:coiled-coil domain-containing protein 169-like isoform X1 [Centruroides sculpturatus]XP_023218682.1 coiled-coil domain-containing protein 169-like isoform X1 [Centruroides sculpturatus]XP_023218684.1 coiled-coil domain-containing protein 169-like isoform X1 [Centruroides sculpturatus]
MPRKLVTLEVADFDDLERLKLEIYDEKRKKKVLEESIAELQQAVSVLEEQTENMDISEDDEWKIRYYTQVEVNQQLEGQRDWLQDRVYSARNQTQDDGNKTIKYLSTQVFLYAVASTRITRSNKLIGIQAMLAELDLDSLTEHQLQRYLKQLEKERNGLYNELRDTEWKLDQESKSFHKFNDTRKAYMTEITDAVLNLEAMKSRMKYMELSDEGSVVKCPRHLKYLNISPDQRVIDPKKGPIRKTAGVRSLPKIETEEKEDKDEVSEEVVA